MDKDYDPEVYVKLKLSSWVNVLHVLGEVGLGKMSKERDEVYKQQYGQFFSIGGFWSQIQHIEAQVDYAAIVHKVSLKDSYTIEAHDPLLDEVCPVCGEAFDLGEKVKLYEETPLSSEDLENKKIGKAYKAFEMVIHEGCNPGTKFVRK